MYGELAGGRTRAQLRRGGPEVLAGRVGEIDWGELALMEEGAARGVGVSFFARWSAT